MAEIGIFALASAAAVTAGRRWYRDNPVPSDDPLLNDRVARLIGETLGYRSVVINVHRPAWDDFIASTVYGDDEIRDFALKFIDKAKADNKPFFLWLNPTRMHIVTHLSPKYQAMRDSKNGWSIHEAGMAQLDARSARHLRAHEGFDRLVRARGEELGVLLQDLVHRAGRPPSRRR